MVDCALPGLAEEQGAVIRLHDDVISAQAPEQCCELRLGDCGERAARAAQSTIGGRRGDAAVLGDGRQHLLYQR